MQTFKKEDNLHKAWLYRVLEAIADNDYLVSVLYFKGGTCASMLGRLDRFSVDLDFDYAGQVSELEKTKSLLEKVYEDLGLEIKDKSKKGLQYFLKYENTIGGRSTIKIDASFPLYKNSIYEIQKFEEIQRILKCQTIETMFAHKLCALMDRFEKTGHIAGRDIYDIHYFFLQGYSYNQEVIEERTGMDAKKYFAKLLGFIESEVTLKIITEDLNPLVSAEKFKILRKVLVREVLMFLKQEIQSIFEAQN